MSKKYIESMNRITVDDKLKKRILQKVSEVKENDSTNNITSIKRNKYNKVWTRSAGLVAACCAFVVCTSLNSKFPELFNRGNIDLSNENVKEDVSETNNSRQMPEECSDSKINTNSIRGDAKEAGTDSACNTSEKDDIYINNNGKEIYNNVVNDRIYQGNVNDNGNYSSSNKVEADLNNYVQEKKDGKNIEVIVQENNNSNNENYEAVSSEDISENDDIQNYEENNISPSMIMKSREMPGNMKEEFELPEVLRNNSEITYTLLVSDDVMEIGFKDEGCDGVVRISSHNSNYQNIKEYHDIDIIKAKNCEAISMINKDSSKKYVEWEYNNKYYSLITDEHYDNAEIVKIIESCS